MIYKLRHFDVRELVPPEIWESRRERSIELLDIEALITLDQLRDQFGACTVNDWSFPSGQYKYSGYRPFDCTVGARLSQHRFGRADDCKFGDFTPKQVFDYVMEHQDQFPHITVIENVEATPTWFHFDTRNHDRQGIWVVNP